MTTAVPRPGIHGMDGVNAIDQSAHEAGKLHELLERGPFPDALRAAIAASGLSLDRVQYRLRRRGVRVSVATLSYWQSGRRRPERPTSLDALAHLEAVLDLAPGALSALLGPPRPRGRRGQDGLPTIESFWGSRSTVSQLLSDFDTTTDLQLRRLSQYDYATIGANRVMRSHFSRQVMRAEHDGPDRWLLVYDWGEDVRGLERPRPEITHVRNCSIGAVRTHEDTSLFCVELVFARPLRRGETLLFEYELRNPGADRTLSEPVDHVARKFRTPCREYLLEVRFDPGAVPARCQQYSVQHEDFVRRTRNLAVDEDGGVHTLAMDFGAGEFGVRWDW
ncbi:hypothetical protein [Sciscionella marina]|uniref:hypothetical protein n=1 Tax=Sciscionella marina TaxID=508770 RepID=UPI00036291E6|nr:hypothetical protein [Sciscionella marina]